MGIASSDTLTSVWYGRLTKSLKLPYRSETNLTAIQNLISMNTFMRYASLMAI